MLQNAFANLSLLCLATFVLGEPPPPPPPSSKPPPLPPVSKLSPPPPPPPLGSGVAVELRLIASGKVSDYPDSSDLQKRIATAGGLWPSDVEISLMDSDGRPDYPNHGRCEARADLPTFCVMIAATLTIPGWRQTTGGGGLNPRAARATVRRSLKANIGTAASASAWLDITVEADPVIVGFTCDDWGGDIPPDDPCATEIANLLPWFLGLLTFCLCCSGCAAMAKARRTESAAAARAAESQPGPQPQLSRYPQLQPQPQQMQMGAVPVCQGSVVQGYPVPVQ